MASRELTLCFLVLQRVHAVRPRFRGLYSRDAGLVCLDDPGVCEGAYILAHFGHWIGSNCLDLNHALAFVRVAMNFTVEAAG